jgi:hypothetical protein
MQGTRFRKIATHERIQQPLQAFEARPVRFTRHPHQDRAERPKGDLARLLPKRRHVDQPTSVRFTLRMSREKILALSLKRLARAGKMCGGQPNAKRRHPGRF